MKTGMPLWHSVTGVNKELEGPQISVRLLAHKIQSPQEREALYALTVSYIVHTDIF